MKKLLVCLLFFSGNSFADFYCKGKISGLGLGKSGVVLVSGPGGLPYTYLCSLNEKINGVEVEACKGVYSTLLTAKAQDKSVNITFNPSIDSCKNVKSWGLATHFNWVIIN
ncbi:hypothetical protein SOPP22_01485 [Shewanella sp. OPT22]|nr:hypothetical protein SOPP22_01485 [Shewanella sp. OPT22]